MSEPSGQEFPKSEFDEWFEERGGESYNSSATLDDPDRFDNPIGYATSYDWWLDRGDEVGPHNSVDHWLHISFTDGEHPELSSEEAEGEFTGKSSLHVDLSLDLNEHQSDGFSFWVIEDIGGHNVRTEEDALILEDTDKGGVVKIVDTGDGFEIYENGSKKYPQNVLRRREKRDLNPNTKYFNVLKHLPEDVWFGSDEAEEMLEGIDGTFRSASQSLTYRDALEKRDHPDNPRRKQWRITDHGKEELMKKV